MHTITECPRCKMDFMYHQTDIHLNRDTTSNMEIIKNYPIQDDTWASRRWNEERTDFEDLSGDFEVICQDCHDEERLIGKEVKILNKDFEHLNNYKLTVKDILRDGSPYNITVQIGDTDSFEWFKEGELKFITITPNKTNKNR